MKSHPATAILARATVALAWLAAGMGLPAASDPADPAATVVYLVRHAEKAGPTDRDDPRDPPLSESGRARAEELADLLGAEEISRIFSTDFRRTRDTAAPLAKRTGKTVESYDPHALEGFARKLRRLPGRHLVVGHSNTTPRLVELLGGSPGTPIDEEGEYDRLYIVVPEDEGESTTISLRYGKPFRRE